MAMTDQALESKYLKASAVGNALVACVGIAAAWASASQAILLDALFNGAYFAAALLTLKVSTLLATGDDERFPYGYGFFEPLVNGLKGMLVLGVTVMALYGALVALFSGGREIAAGLAIAYGTFASITCWLIALVTRHGAAKTESPLVRADAENWIVNAAVSSCVLLAFGGILALRRFELNALVPYVDPVVVLTVVVVSIGVPIRMAWDALMALLNRAPRREIVEQVSAIVDETLADLPVEDRFVRVLQPGRHRMVTVHVVLPEGYRIEGLATLDGIRARVAEALTKPHKGTLVDVLFTADRRWGAPLSEGGQGA